MTDIETGFISELNGAELDRVQEYLEVWAGRLESHKEDLVPEANLVLKKDGKPDIQIHQFSYKNPMTGMTVWLMLAMDDENNLVGMRQSYLSDASPAIKGDIEVFERGKGYATALEVAHNMLIQKRLDESETSEEYEYEIDDENQNRITNLEIQLQGELSKEQRARISKELETAKKQRLAWEKLYGLGGKLGFEEERGRLVKRFRKGEKQETLGYSVEEDTNRVSPKEVIKNKLDMIVAK